MDYEKELSRIRKLLEEVNCSDDEKSDEDNFSSDSSGEEDCLEDMQVSDSDNCMSDSENLRESLENKKSKFGAWVGKDKTTWWRKNARKFYGLIPSLL